MKIYSKLEYYNLTGSIKDRIAVYMLKQAYMNKEINEDDLILEATSGNTGISFAAVGSYLGHDVHIYMPDWMSSERKKLLESYNAKLHLVSKEDGGFLKCISLTEQCKANCSNIFLPRQFSNEDNINAHYNSTAPEIYSTLRKHHLSPSIFVAGVGTGGTVMGISHTGCHRIQGISDEFVPEIVDLTQLDEVISVDDGDAIIMAQMLSKEFGLGVGISSGANFIGAIKALEINKSVSGAITIFADDNKKYLSTDLMNKEPVKAGFISSDVKLIDFRVL